MIDSLQVAKSIFLYFIWRVGGWFKKKSNIFEKKNFHFVLLLNFLMILLLHKS